MTGVDERLAALDLAWAAGDHCETHRVAMELRREIRAMLRQILRAEAGSRK